MSRDVFLCHATLDKERYVRPLVAALREYAISYWLDEAEIRWGDRITERINIGLRDSRHVLVFLTEAFLQRNWPQTELGHALNLEASTGRVVVLPILAAPDEVVFQRYPLLRDKLYLRWDEGPAMLAAKLAARLGREYRTHWVICHPATYAGPVWLHFVPRPENGELDHEYRLRWGPWSKAGVAQFTGAPGLSLVHTKGDDGLSIPIIVDVNPECYVTFGQGDAPGFRQIDINEGWIRDA